MQTLWQDLRFGARMLFKNPGFTLIAVFTLALGIGANTAIFSLLDAILLKSLPVRDPAALVQLKWAAGDGFRGFSYSGSEDRKELPGLRVATSFAPATFELLRAQRRTLTNLCAYAPVEQLNVNVNGQSEIASGQVVTGNYHNTLGVTAWLGRTLTPEDDQAAAPAVAVLSYGCWQRRFGADAAVIGKQINVNSAAFTIVGVTPPDFSGTQGKAPDLSVALAQEPLLRGTGSSLRQSAFWWLRVMGRMKPGVTREQVQAELSGLFQPSALDQRLAARKTQVAQAETPRLLVAPGQQGETGWRRPYAAGLYLLMTVVGLILLIACANVANLLLARAAARRKEIAIRLALGASRFRLMRQLLTESLLLALTGGALGVLVAVWARDLLLRLPDRQEMSELSVSLNWRVLGFTLAASLLTGVLFGLLPAWQATRVDVTPVLKDASRNASAPSRSRLSRALVVAQVALSLLLLVGAGLFIRTLRNLQQVDAGFTTQNLLLFRVDPRLSGYEGERIAPLYQRMFTRLESVPGVQAVTFSRHPLLSGSSGERGIFIAGQNIARDKPLEAKVHIVRANFFAALNVRLLQGRGLTEQDNAQAPKTAVINQTLARRFFSNQNPVGQRLSFDPDEPGQIEIVGVTQDAKYNSLRDETPPTVYLPWLQETRVGQMNFTLRTAGDPLALLPAIRQAVREVDGNLPLFEVKTQTEQIAQLLAQERVFALLLGFFGGLALLLASLGLYGVLSHAVAQRTHEIGIRTALGAQPRDVLRLVVAQGMKLTLIGVVFGVVGALAVTRLMKSLLFEVSATDPLSFVTVAALLCAVALLACWIPAHRATKVDPMIALRCD